MKMNRFGIKFTEIYWVALGLSFLAVFAFYLLDVFFPSHLWILASAAAMVLLGRIAAKTCLDKNGVFPFGRAFLWSFMSYSAGSWAASALSNHAGWKEPMVFDYSFNTFSEGEASSQFNEAIASLIEFAQSPEALLGLDFVQIMYVGVIISIITGSIIKIVK